MNLPKTKKPAGVNLPNTNNRRALSQIFTVKQGFKKRRMVAEANIERFRVFLRSNKLGCEIVNVTLVESTPKQSETKLKCRNAAAPHSIPNFSGRVGSTSEEDADSELYQKRV